MGCPYGSVWVVYSIVSGHASPARKRTLAFRLPFGHPTAELQNPMTRDQITETLKSLLRQQKTLKIEVDKISPESRIDAIGFDSITILDFVYDLEERFKVRIEMADLVSIRHVKDLIGYLEG